MNDVISDMLREEKEREEIMDSIDRTLEIINDLPPNNPRIGVHFTSLIPLYLQINLDENARTVLEFAIKHGDGIAALAMYAGQMEERCIRKKTFLGNDFEEAMSGYTRLMELDPTQGNFLLGELFERKGNKKKAIVYYERTVNAKGYSAYINLAERKLNELRAEFE